MISSKHPKMVGYSQEDSLSHSQKLIAGSVSGLVTRFVIQPLDVLKLRTQLQKKMPEGKSLNLHSMTKKILTEEGITAFRQGHVLGQAHSILSSTSQFFVYEMTTKLISSYPVDPKYKSVLEFMCGITAGFCCATLTIPLEVIRVRQALVKQQYGGLLNGAKAVYASGGVMAFFEGWTASVLMLGPQVGITFSVFSLMQPMILSYLYKCNSDCSHPKTSAHKPEHLVLTSSIAGSISGIVSKTTTYPLDLAKRRLQIASHKPQERFQAPTTSRNLIKCTELIKCLTDTVKIEGFFGLYCAFW
ncbi:mitochondrial thiamine pyrophosphate carrier-like [Maniola jurtina]|uniref:mitochondrial thiamine pyrophosphate carrier-like n=1 Tax=Maniola jurtina TaxID=191418 RepID=UPI001E68645B|nr:mitochondrial thiamine pyrophosphate carrier-like [Maniola jurtina]